MSREAINALFSELGSQLGMDQLALDENDHCVLRIDEGSDIHLEYLEESGLLLMVSALPGIEAEYKAAVYEIMLKGNYLWQDTYGATLAIHPETNAVIVEHKMNVANIAPGSLQEHVSGLDALVQGWQEHIKEIIEAIDLEKSKAQSNAQMSPSSMNMLRG